jgi:universal stress protein A
MNAKKILFPTDFSPASDAALARATSLARDTGATLVICHVVLPLGAYTGAGEFVAVPPPLDTADAEAHIERIVPGDPEVPYVHRVVTGDPATEIVRLAHEEDVDFIVMGTHGRTGLTRILMGSVAEAVVRQANCPVLTCKETEPSHVAS